VIDPKAPDQELVNGFECLMRTDDCQFEIDRVQQFLLEKSYVLATEVKIVIDSTSSDDYV